jgi:hypothetical protein
LQRTGIASESVRSGDLAYLESPSAEKNTTSRIGKLLPECVALLAFATLVAATIPWHEPFADEAQAWQLARTFSLPELFQTYIRYEAAPGLWHFLLWIFIRLHVSYSGLHWICGAIATLAAAVLLFKAPFPRYLRLSLPFTYYLLFQYAVVARNYVLAPLLMFLIAACWRKSPLIVAVLLGLLANVSLHAATISGGFAILFLLEQLRSSDGRRERKTLLIWGALVVLCLYALAIWTAWPPHDLPLSRFRGVSRPIVTATIGALTVGICDPWLLGFVFWIAVAVCLRARRRMLYLLPAGLFAVFSLCLVASRAAVSHYCVHLLDHLARGWSKASPRRDCRPRRSGLYGGVPDSVGGIRPLARPHPELFARCCNSTVSCALCAESRHGCGYALGPA